MVNTLDRLVGTQRVRTLLESYGADPVAWPAEERQAAKVLLERDPELQDLREQALPLDAALQAFRRMHLPQTTDVTGLADRIMRALPGPAGLPPGLFRHRYALGWFSGVAASLLIAAVLFFAQSPVSVQDRTASELAQSEDKADVFAEWAWEDVTGEVLLSSEESESDLFPLYALVAPELIDEER